MIRLLILLLLLLASGCRTMSPSEWSADKQVRMQQACRVACYPEPMYSYEAMSGKCICNVKRK